RRVIAASTDGACRPTEELQDIYVSHKAPVDRKLLSHLAGCEGCLDKVNDILSIPRLSTRYPLDSLQPYIFLLILTLRIMFETVQNIDIDGVLDCIDC